VVTLLRVRGEPGDAPPQRRTRAVAVRLRCPSGAARACRGTLIVGQSGTGGARGFAVAPGRSGVVVVPLTARMRRLVAAHRRLGVSMAGASAEGP